MVHQIVDFFSGLFDTSQWPARWHCGTWSAFHGWLYIISDLTIWFSYFLIPIIIMDYFFKKKGLVKFNKVYFLFAAFILLCGATHFMDVVMFWIPMYRLNALIRLVTAVVSLLTTYYLIKILPEAFRARTSIELEREIVRRKEAELNLAEANRNINNFAYMASHDLQEPLRKIQIFTNRLYESEETKGNLTTRNYMDKISSSAGKMQQLTKDLLNLAVLEKQIDLGEMDVEKSIGMALSVLDLKMKEKDAKVLVGSIPQVIGNDRYLSQLFFNLIGNSLKFSERPPEIRITGERIGDRVVIHISDNGIGMGQDGIDRIFEAFQRLNDTSVYEGSGLGLAICKRIMSIHNGFISVKSKVGVGSTFTIELQAAPGGAGPAAPGGAG